MKKYAIKEIFYSVQGEGFYAGTPSVFVRFGACNLWSGKVEHRERDAERNNAACPKWCDTDFASAPMMTASDVKAAIDEFDVDACEHVVFTGGEPMLHLDPTIIHAVRSVFAPGVRIAIETNGTIRVPASLDVDWITVSPKTHESRILQGTGNELKVVWPGSAQTPNEYRKALGRFVHHYVSPLAELVGGGVGHSLIDKDNLAQALAYVQTNPGWKLSLQTHKILGAR